MTWFGNLKMVWKLTTFLGLMVVLLGLTAWMGLSSARSMKANQDATFEADFKTVLFVDDLARERLTMARIARDEIIEPDLKVMAAYRRERDEVNRVSQERFAEVEKVVPDEAAQRSLREAAELSPFKVARM